MTVDERSTERRSERVRDLVRTVRRGRPDLGYTDLVDLLVRLGVDAEAPEVVAELGDLPGSPRTLADEEAEGSRTSRTAWRALAGLAGVAIVAVSGAALYLAADDPNEPVDIVLPTTSTTTTAPTTSTFPGTTTTTAEPPAPQFAPTGPGSDPELEDGGDAIDTFERGGPLGEFGGVGPWIVGRGEWQALFGAAVLAEVDPAGANIAWVDAGTTDLRAQVELTDFDEGAGLAFRVVDEDDFWLWTPVPEFGSMVLLRFKDGVARNRGNPGIVDVEEGMQVGVNLSGGTVELLVNGAVAMTVEDPDARPGTGLGVAVTNVGDAAAFDDLVLARSG